MIMLYLAKTQLLKGVVEKKREGGGGRYWLKIVELR